MLTHWLKSTSIFRARKVRRIGQTLHYGKSFKRRTTKQLNCFHLGFKSEVIPSKYIIPVMRSCYKDILSDGKDEEEEVRGRRYSLEPIIKRASSDHIRKVLK